MSLAALAFEVILTRVFSIGQWNHLSFMVISLALFGFGASGTFLSIVEVRPKNWLQKFQSPRGMIILICLYAAATILSFLVTNHLPLDYFRLAIAPDQLLYLLMAYILLALPFFFAGMIMTIAYITIAPKTGLVYFASMTGSALGAAFPIPLLPWLGEGRLVMVTALLALVPALFCSCHALLQTRGLKEARTRRPVFGAAFSLGLMLLALLLMAPPVTPIIHVTASPYKALSQILQFPETRIAETSTGIRARIDRVTTPYIRFAPGLSLKFNTSLPGQNAVFKDGENQWVLYDLKSDRFNSRFAPYLLSYGPYYLTQNPKRVLLLVAGGGSSIACALASGADQVTIVQKSPKIVEILGRHYPFHLVCQPPRVFLARDEATYDIIQVENWGPSLPGTAALNQEHLLTTEAFIEFWHHLKPQGVMAISRKLLLPPSDSLRLWSTAYEALMRTGIEQPEDHLAMLRNFDTFTLLVSKASINRQRLSRFAENRNFDLIYLAGMAPESANRFHIFDEPYHYQAVNQLVKMYRTGRQNHFFRQYLLDVAPQSDLRPFPARFLKWSRLAKLYHSMGSRLYALFMSAEIVVSVVFCEALLVALLLLLIPLFISTRGARKPKPSQIIYFFGIGAGFMFAEIYFIKRFILVVGNPVISFSLVIAGMLTCTGLGGIWVHHTPRQRLRTPLVLLTTVLILETVAFELIAGHILKASDAAQYLVMFLFLLPVGFLMGLPFPLGMRYLLDTPVQRAYAWSVNGCASVLSAIVAAQIAISLGIVQIAIAGASAYTAAYFAVSKGR